MDQYPGAPGTPGPPDPQQGAQLTRRQLGAVMLVVGVVLAVITAIFAIPIVGRALTPYQPIEVQVVRQGPYHVESGRRTLSRERTVYVVSEDPRLLGAEQLMISRDARPGERFTAWYKASDATLTEHHPGVIGPGQWVILGLPGLGALGCLAVSGVLLWRGRTRRQN